LREGCLKSDLGRVNLSVQVKNCNLLYFKIYLGVEQLFNNPVMLPKISRGQRDHVDGKAFKTIT
jgi:hypothetical protein